MAARSWVPGGAHLGTAGAGGGVHASRGCRVGDYTCCLPHWPAAKTVLGKAALRGFSSGAARGAGQPRCAAQGASPVWRGGPCRAVLRRRGAGGAARGCAGRGRAGGTVEAGHADGGGGTRAS